ncbi:MAG: hypothetical protein R3208_02870 [Ketobacteraceae bacterium]|nr:hypothetical protein [Ketobacteraceae bacterium]
MSPPDEIPLWVLLSAAAVLTGLLGWLSHWLAVWLSFKPLRFRGIGPLGWQGIIPRRASEIAVTITRDLINQFANVGQIFEYLSPERIVTQITGNLRPQLDTLVDEVMLENHTILWENLPVSLKNRMYARMHRMLPRVVDDIIEDIGDQILWIVKIEDLVVQQFERHPDALVELFRDCSGATLNRVGWFFAITCSILSWIPLTAWLLTDIWWVLPLGLSGLLVITSWVALRYLFTPLEVRFLGMTWRNSFKQQKEKILHTFVTMLSEDILTSEKIFDEVFKGSKSRHAMVLIKKHVNKIVDHNVIRSFVQVTTGLEGFVDIKQTLVEHIARALMEPLNDKRFNMERAQALNELFVRHIPEIDDEHFKSLVWPIMQAEKAPLQILSAGAGIAAGFALLRFL